MRGWRRVAAVAVGWLTELDGESGRKLHLDEVADLAEVLERGDDLEDVQQPGRFNERRKSLTFEFRSIKWSYFTLK